MPGIYAVGASVLVFGAFLGMDAQELKEVGAILIAVYVIYEQRQARSAAQKSTEETVKGTERLAVKLQEVENNVNGKMSQFLDEHGKIKKLEGKEEGKVAAQAEAATIRDAVKDAIAQAVPPSLPPPPVDSALVKPVEVEVVNPHVPVKVVKDKAKSPPPLSNDDAPPG